MASSEALVVLHWVMRPALHRRIRMVVKMVVDLPAGVVHAWVDQNLLNCVSFFSVLLVKLFKKNLSVIAS